MTATEHSRSHTRLYSIVFVILLVLLAATVGLNELPLGAFAFLAAVLIATLKAALILLFFMHVWWSRPLIWLAAGAALVWLGILFGLAFTDYGVRKAPADASGAPPLAEQLGIEACSTFAKLEVFRSPAPVVAADRP